MSIAQASAAPAWRTPAPDSARRRAISFIGFGPRSVFGFFLQPISNEFGWGRNVFALSFALQQLFWGIGQPFAGAIADRFGASRVLIGGALLYLAGLLLMTVSSEPALMHITAGVMIGFALAGCSFNVVLGAFAKLLPPEKRGLGLGLGTAAGSFGQFVCSPFAPDAGRRAGLEGNALRAGGGDADHRAAGLCALDGPGGTRQVRRAGGVDAGTGLADPAPGVRLRSECGPDHGTRPGRSPRPSC